MSVINSHCLFKELLRPRPSGCQCGRCSQDHKSMCITLFIGNNATLLCHTCIPATIFVIVKLSPKTFQRRIHKLSASFMAKHQSQAVYMCHAAGDPGFPVSVLPWCSVIPQIIGTSIWRRKPMSEVQKILTGCFQEFPVFFSVDLIFTVHFNHPICFSLGYHSFWGTSIPLDYFDRLMKKENAAYAFSSYPDFLISLP